jgi:hypothetical protein
MIPTDGALIALPMPARMSAIAILPVTGVADGDEPAAHGWNPRIALILCSCFPISAEMRG